MTKVIVVANGEESEVDDFDVLTSVEVRGATGVARYTLDPRQDAVIKIVVNGNIVTHKDESKSLNPADHPVPQIQTGDAGNSDKQLVEVADDPVIRNGGVLPSSKQVTVEEANKRVAEENPDLDNLSVEAPDTENKGGPVPEPVKGNAADGMQLSVPSAAPEGTDLGTPDSAGDTKSSSKKVAERNPDAVSSSTATSGDVKK